MSAIDFVPIRVSTLRGDLKIPFDVYVRVAGKNILYCRNGDSFEGARLKRLKEKKLKKLYIHLKDEPLYRSYLTENIEMAYEGTRGKPIEIRAEVIQGAQQAAAENVMEDPESDEFYRVAKNGSSRYVDFLLKNQSALKSVMNIENSDKNIAHHGVTVATLAVGMAEKLGLHKARAEHMEILALGCLLHDIEHFHTTIENIKKVSDMTTEELKNYQRHPELGAARVKDKLHFDPLVVQIIGQHEERIDGSGFPHGLTEKDMDELVMIAATANTYDRIVTFHGLDHKAALKTLLIDHMGHHRLEHMKVLQDVLKDNGLM